MRMKRGEYTMTLWGQWTNTEASGQHCEVFGGVGGGGGRTSSI